MLHAPIIFKDKYLIAIFAVSAIFLAIAFGIAYATILSNSNLLVIHFDTYRGVDFFGDSRDVADILVTGAIVLILNSVLANELYFRERILSYALTASTLLFSVLILMAVNAIIFIN